MAVLELVVGGCFIITALLLAMLGIRCSGGGGGFGTLEIVV